MTTTTAPPTTHPTTHPTATAASRLRTVLLANAATSVVGGLVGLLAAEPLADRSGLGSAGWVRVVSVALVLFGVEVAVGVRAGRLGATALVATAGDVAWLVGTMAVLAAVDLTGGGRLVAVVMGVGVFDLALLQLWFRHRLDA